MGPDKTDWYSVIYHNDNGKEYELDSCHSYEGPGQAERNAKAHALRSMGSSIPTVSINLRREYVYVIVNDVTKKPVRRVTVTHEITSDTAILS